MKTTWAGCRPPPKEGRRHSPILSKSSPAERTVTVRRRVETRVDRSEPWFVRAGRLKNFEAGSYAPIGGSELTTVSSETTEDELRRILAVALPDAKLRVFCYSPGFMWARVNGQVRSALTLIMITAHLSQTFEERCPLG
jgi:hypothetical protein